MPMNVYLTTAMTQAMAEKKILGDEATIQAEKLQPRIPVVERIRIREKKSGISAIDVGKILENLIPSDKTIKKLADTALQTVVQKALTPKQAVNKVSQYATDQIITQTGLTPSPEPSKTEPAKIPTWAIAGGIAGVGLVAILLLRKK
jgi:hypothetical protein